MADYIKYLFVITKIKVQQQVLRPPKTPPPYVKIIPFGPKEILYTSSAYTDFKENFLRRCFHENTFLNQSLTPLDSMYKLYKCIMYKQLNLSKVEVRYFYS